MKCEIFYKKIEDIVEKEKPYGILLVGSLSRMSELDFDNVRDVDIFVITDDKEFKRHVIDIEGLEFDISYMPQCLLDVAIKRRLASIICVLAKSKILYKSEKNTLKNSLKVIESIYDEGPHKLTQTDIDYERFKLTNKYLTVESRKEDSLNFNFLKGIFLKDLIASYFKLNNIWMPPEKRMLKSIKDNKLKSLIEIYLLKKDLDITVELTFLESLLDTVLETFGGKLEFWEKDKFPFDFL